MIENTNIRLSLSVISNRTTSGYYRKGNQPCELKKNRILRIVPRFRRLRGTGDSVDKNDLKVD